MRLPPCPSIRPSRRPSLASLIPWVITLVSIHAVPFARAESTLLFDLPREFGAVGATTFDERGHAIGRSSLSVDASDPSLFRMKVDLAGADGGANRSEAVLAPVTDPQSGNPKLKLVEQRSQAFRPGGDALALLVIDHRRGRASCYATSDVDSPGQHVELADDDRAVNVPLHLLFRPLVQRKVKEIRFQLVLCRGEPVIQDMIAVRGPETEHEGQEVVEVRYGPDFGSAVAFFASRLLPRFSFWFSAGDAEYVGHRMPLYRKGPMVLLLRQGFAPPDLGLAAR